MHFKVYISQHFSYSVRSIQFESIKFFMLRPVDKITEKYSLFTDRKFFIILNESHRMLWVFNTPKL